ncbi:mitochondrial cardiolipin hydrolase-like [Bombyx mandarina]|uniref:Mitochondrial cardiolipin hydrolase n=1 Tax=Bombyx mandarina TaxID=7092 RepID=A0A6J2JHF3_BOMMA|nr:mitochondrial cardiolipin hydrolase-like [Bombyx mandarina]
MKLYPRIFSSAAAFALTCVVFAAAYFYKSRNTELNEVMVFCKLHLNAYNCFDKLMSFIEAAKHNIKVCMPGIHNVAIQGRLVEMLKKKNIKISIVIDQSGCNEPNDVFIKELLDAGAVIKYINTEPYTMQHKFCLIDDKVLMTGTLNWGNDRSSDHWNYVYITSKPKLVEPVSKEFKYMWLSSKDLNYSQFDSKLINEDECCNTEVVNLTENYKSVPFGNKETLTSEICIV